MQGQRHQLPENIPILTNWACWNNRHVVLKKRESLYRWRFGCRRYRGKLIHHFILVFFFYIFPLARPAVRISSLLFFKIWYWRFLWSRSIQDPLTSLICSCGFTYRVFSLTWSASMQIYWNKRKRLHKKRVQFPEDWFGTPTWPPIHCLGTPIWPPWRHIKTLYLLYLFSVFFNGPVWENPSTSPKRAP